MTDHAQNSPGKNYLTEARGLKSWLLTLDHKRIGVMYLVGILAAFFGGGVLALLVRTEHMSREQTIVNADTYNQLFTLHGAIMVFLFIIPSIPAALGNFVLPMMLGAKDVAFPKLNLASFYCWIGGAVFALLAIVMGKVDTGWTFYAPYSMDPSNWSVVLISFGVFILGFSSILTGVNFVATVHMMRAAGMGWFRMPLMVWGLYATAIIQILATPVLAITVLLLLAENLLQIGIFNAKLGGDPVLFQHFFWFYSHPAVYIMILPGMGIISELISTFSHKRIFGYRLIAYSSIAIAIFGFLVWGHHMFTSGQSVMTNAIFSFLTYSVSIPSAIKVFNWLATMYRGSIDLRAPMIYALSFIILFAIGGLTGLFLGALAVDVHLHDTYFVVAHFHYTMMGGTVFAFLGGLHYWWPKITGRMYHERSGRLGAILIFIGFNVTFFPQFLLGSQGMPRRYWQIPDVSFDLLGHEVSYLALHQLSTIGSFVMAIGFVVAAYSLFGALRSGKVAPANPWGAATLEWQTPSPPPHTNFDDSPTAGDPYDLTRLQHDSATDSWSIAAANSSSEDRSWSGSHSEHEVAHHFETAEQQFATAKLGMWLFLATEILMFSGLFVAYAVYRNLHPEIFVLGAQYLDTGLGALNTLILLASSFTVAWGVRAAQLGQKNILVLCLVATVLGGFGFMGIKYVEYSHKLHLGLGPGSMYAPAQELVLGDDPVGSTLEDGTPRFTSTELAIARPFFSIYFALTGLHGIHVLVGIGVMVWLLLGAIRGRYGPSRFTAVDLGGLYWHLVDLIWIYLFPLLYLID